MSIAPTLTGRIIRADESGPLRSPPLSQMKNWSPGEAPDSADLEPRQSVAEPKRSHPNPLRAVISSKGAPGSTPAIQLSTRNPTRVPTEDPTGTHPASMDSMRATQALPPNKRTHSERGLDEVVPSGARW